MNSTEEDDPFAFISHELRHTRESIADLAGIDLDHFNLTSAAGCGAARVILQVLSNTAASIGQSAYEIDIELERLVDVMRGDVP